MMQEAAGYVRLSRHGAKSVTSVNRATRSVIFGGYIAQSTAPRSNFLQAGSRQNDRWTDEMCPSGLSSSAIPRMQSAKEGLCVMICSEVDLCCLRKSDNLEEVELAVRTPVTADQRARAPRRIVGSERRCWIMAGIDDRLPEFNWISPALFPGHSEERRVAGGNEKSKKTHNRFGCGLRDCKYWVAPHGREASTA